MRLGKYIAARNIGPVQLNGYFLFEFHTIVKIQDAALRHKVTQFDLPKTLFRCCYLN